MAAPPTDPKANEANTALFAFFDADNSGGLTLEELKEGLASVGSKHSDEQMNEFFNTYDKDKNGLIDFGEFLALCIAINTDEMDAAVGALFKKIDANGDRTLTKQELREGIAIHTGKDVNDEAVTKLIKEIDADGDGDISYEEFTKNLLVKISVAVKK